MTEPDTDHAENLAQNSSMSLSIYDSRHKWKDKKKGLQVFGEAEKIEQEKVSNVFKLYTERFLGLKEFVSDPDGMDEIDLEFYVIKTERIKIFDEPEFGKEIWVNVGY